MVGTLPLSTGSVHDGASSSSSLPHDAINHIPPSVPSVAFAGVDQVVIVPSASSDGIAAAADGTTASNGSNPHQLQRGMSRAATSNRNGGLIEAADEMAKRIEHTRLMRIVQVLEKLVKAGLVIGEPWKAGYCAFKMAHLAVAMNNDAVLALSYSQCASACLELSWLPLAQVYSKLTKDTITNAINIPVMERARIFAQV